MNLINDFNKRLLDIMVPYIKSVPYLFGIYKKKKDLSQEQRFRDLFKKRKTALIVGTFLFCLIIFGIDKIFSLFAVLIACSPFVVIFWSSFGDLLMSIFKYKKNK